MKIYHNVQKRSLKWIIILFLFVGIFWLTLEVFSLSFELVSTTVTGCLNNEECFFNLVTYVIDQPPEQ